MEVVFIDPEPPDITGGGIRTYLRLALKACRERDCEARVYTHNPQAYPGERVAPIGRKPWLKSPWRGLAYRFLYSENVLWEHANWLSAELEACHATGKIYEFADFMGYAFFSLRNPVLQNRIVVRVHTPNYLVLGKNRGPLASLAGWLCAWREKDSLNLAQHITVPSAEFVKEMLPDLRNWVHIPNPMPLELNTEKVSEASIPSVNPEAESGVKRFLYLGRVEPRKGVLLLVRVFLKLASEDSDVSLTLVGGSVPGPYAQSVRTLIDSQTSGLRARITWEPPCPTELRSALFARFQVLVVPSLWENSPYVYFEGMAAGLLVLGSATGEMKAVAKITKGPTAIPGDETDWERALRAVAYGAHREVHAAQAEFLRTRRPKIPDLLVNYYRGLVDG